MILAVAGNLKVEKKNVVLFFLSNSTQIPSVESFTIIHERMKGQL